MLFFCDWLQQSSFLLTLDVKFCFKAFFSHLKEKKENIKGTCICLYPDFSHYAMINVLYVALSADRIIIVQEKFTFIALGNKVFFFIFTSNSSTDIAIHV